jgi:hypothetical protein
MAHSPPVNREGSIEIELIPEAFAFAAGKLKGPAQDRSPRVRDAYGHHSGYGNNIDAPSCSRFNV